MTAIQPMLPTMKPKGLPPRLDEYHLFWCCADCYPVLQGGTSLVWQPKDGYRTGVCVICGRQYTFNSPYGKEELRVQNLESLPQPA